MLNGWLQIKGHTCLQMFLIRKSVCDLIPNVSYIFEIFKYCKSLKVFKIKNSNFPNSDLIESTEKCLTILLIAMKNAFLFRLQSSFCSLNIQIFVLTFWVSEKLAPRKIAPHPVQGQGLV